MKCGATTLSNKSCKNIVCVDGARCHIHSHNYGLCSICLNDISSNPEILNCGHFFHRDCIQSWKKEMKKNFSCPLCRKQITYTFTKSTQCILKKYLSSDNFEICLDVAIYHRNKPHIIKEKLDELFCP